MTEMSEKLTTKEEYKTIHKWVVEEEEKVG